MRKNRYFQRDQVYEVVSRATHGIPFAPTQSTLEIFQGIMGRTCRKDEVHVCHAVNMGNHGHYMCKPKKVKALSNFYQEINKRSTEALKVLLDLNRLRLWEDRANVAHLPEKEDAIKKVIYIYCNPAEAGLVDSIDEYTGFNTWKAFLTCPPDINACVEENVRYYFKRALKRLPANNVLDPFSDRQYLAHLKDQPVQTGRVNIVSEEVLRIRPFAFLEPYGITDPKEIEEIRLRIKTEVYKREATLKAERAAAGRPALGVERLQLSEFMKAHTPKEHRPKISVICENPLVRGITLIKEHDILERCRDLRKLAEAGDLVTWPHGVFVPWRPPSDPDTNEPPLATPPATETVPPSKALQDPQAVTVPKVARRVTPVKRE